MRSPPSLQVVPVLDVLGGQVVRALRGERSAYRPIVSPLAPGSDPGTLARALLARTRSRVLYVADLDALQGRPVQFDVFAQLLAQAPASTLWIDAGLRDAADAARLHAAFGARVRPVFGSESLVDADALRETGDAILSLDSRHDRALDPAGVWTRPALWPGTVVVMTLDRVGAQAGPDLARFAQLRALAPDRQWIGAGGVRDAAAAGADGWLVASALHDGTLGEA